MDTVFTDDSLSGYGDAIAYYVGERVGEAVSLWRTAADNGNIEASMFLSTCYLLGKGVERDFQKAAEVLLRGVDDVTQLDNCPYVSVSHNVFAERLDPFYQMLTLNPPRDMVDCVLQQMSIESIFRTARNRDPKNKVEAAEVWYILGWLSLHCDPPENFASSIRSPHLTEGRREGINITETARYTERHIQCAGDAWAISADMGGDSASGCLSAIALRFFPQTPHNIKNHILNATRLLVVNKTKRSPCPFGQANSPLYDRIHAWLPFVEWALDPTKPIPCVNGNARRFPAPV